MRLVGMICLPLGMIHPHDGQCGQHATHVKAGLTLGVRPPRLGKIFWE